MVSFTAEELSEAKRAITSTVGKCEKAYGKLKRETSQHTLMKNRLAAFYIALALIDEKLEKQGDKTCF